MAAHSSTLAWKIPWTEEPGGLQSMGSLRVGHNWATSLSLFTFIHWRRKWQPNPVFSPGESQGWGAWWASVYRVTESRTQLKWLSSSSNQVGMETLAERFSPGARILSMGVVCMLRLFWHNSPLQHPLCFKHMLSNFQMRLLSNFLPKLLTHLIAH